MALPADITTATLTFGPYFDAHGASACPGLTITITPDRRVLHVGDGSVLLPAPLKLTLDATSSGSIVLPNTDCPTLNSSFVYLVSVGYAGGRPTPPGKTIALPQASGTVVDYDQLTLSTLPSPVIAVPAVSSVVGQSGAVTGAQIAADPALRAAFVPKWQASHAYTSGDFVLNPSGQVVSANTTFTSGASYVADNWTIVAGGGSSNSFTVDGAAPTGGVLDISSTAVTATDIAFTPTGTIAAATVQAAIAEAASEAIQTSAKGANSGVASLDSSGQVPLSQLGNAPSAGSTPDAWVGYAASNLAGSSSNTVITAGRTWFARVTRGFKTGATKVGLQVGTASGNVMVGVYSPTGTGTAALPGALKGSSVVTACPAAGYGEVTLQAATDVNVGDYLAFWCDNATATFAYLGNNAATLKAISCYNDAGTGITSMPAGPIASGSLNGFSRHYTLTGV